MPPLAWAAVLFAQSAWAIAQTTSGTSTTIVVPLLAQTASYASEVTVFNPNASAISIQITFYDAQNTGSPGPKSCTALPVASGRSAQFAVATECALPAGSNFGLLVLKEATATQRFYGFVRTQTPQGVGFSTEGFPIENFNDQLQHATGLKRVAAGAGLPAFQTNCFVATLGDAVSYELRLFDGSSNAQLGGTLSGSLAAFQQFRYLDVFAAAGVAAGDRTNVRAQFTNLTGANKKLIGFCTVQENTTFSADFRIAKSYGGTPQNAFVQGGNGFGTTALLGTVDNEPIDIMIAGQSVMRYEPSATSPNIMGGHSNNYADPAFHGQTVAGGGLAGNTCYEPSTQTDTRFCGNRAVDNFAVVGGGYSNTAQGDSGVIGGGQANTVAGAWPTVGGGFGNLASNSAYGADTVAGGYRNTSTGGVGSVAGGILNTALGWAAAISGGDENSALEQASAVGGGSFNIAGGKFSAVVGGTGNKAYGQYSTVGGGNNNTAYGDGSFVAGTSGEANAAGQFIWNDASASPNAFPIAANAFSAKATGGVYFLIAFNAGLVSQECKLTPGVAGWQCTSDRDAKENLVAVNGDQILERLVAMPVYSWNFKGSDPNIRSLGPTAQDFYGAFALGDDDKTISTSNVEGVTLAAIQGLYRRVAEGEARAQEVLTNSAKEISSLSARLTVQEEELALLRGALHALVARDAKRQARFHSSPSAMPSGFNACLQCASE